MRIWYVFAVFLVLLALGCVATPSTEEMSAYLRVMGMDANVSLEGGEYFVYWEMPAKSPREAELAYAVVKSMCKRFDVSDVVLVGMLDEETEVARVKVCG